MKGVIFDLDGTLVDSMPMWKQLDKNFLEQFGVEYNKKVSEQIIGMTLEQSAAFYKDAYNIDLSTEEILSKWKEFLLDQYKNNVPLKKGVLEYLEFLQKNNIKTCVATLTEKNFATAVLKKHNLIEKIGFTLTVYEVGKSKLFPDIYISCANRMGVNIKDCIVFEDSIHAIVTAKKAGFKVFGVWDDACYQQNIEQECDYLVKDYKDLIKLGRNI